MVPTEMRKHFCEWLKSSVYPVDGEGSWRVIIKRILMPMRVRNMKRFRGNVWEWSKPCDDIVIPTSVGWRTNGEAVMGFGLARDAARYYPQILSWYGFQCQEFGYQTPVLRYGPLVLFPIKPINEAQPYLSWQQSPDLPTIAESLDQLAKLPPRCEGLTIVPMLGCGRDGLERMDVVPLIEDILGHDKRFVLLEKDGMA